jgi:hypothetical protein
MILFPEVQEKARAHVEAVCGDRLPEMVDYDNLPYIRAVMKETVRWLPTAVLGAVVIQSHVLMSLDLLTIMLQPHAVTQDDYYMVRAAGIRERIALIITVTGLLDPQRRRSDQQRLHNLFQP